MKSVREFSELLAARLEAQASHYAGYHNDTEDESRRELYGSICDILRDTAVDVREAGRED